MEGNYQKFYELDIWKNGFNLQKEIFEIALRFPDKEKFGLYSQLTRSSNSIIANIAEAHGRYHYADKVRVLYISRGEIEETQSHLIVAASRHYISEEISTRCIANYETLKMQLNKYISQFNQLR